MLCSEATETAVEAFNKESAVHYLFQIASTCHVPISLRTLAGWHYISCASTMCVCSTSTSDASGLHHILAKSRRRKVCVCVCMCALCLQPSAYRPLQRTTQLPYRASLLLQTFWLSWKGPSQITHIPQTLHRVHWSEWRWQVRVLEQCTNKAFSFGKEVLLSDRSLPCCMLTVFYVGGARNIVLLLLLVSIFPAFILSTVRI